MAILKITDASGRSGNTAFTPATCTLPRPDNTVVWMTFAPRAITRTSNRYEDGTFTLVDGAGNQRELVASANKVFSTADRITNIS